MNIKFDYGNECENKETTKSKNNVKNFTNDVSKYYSSNSSKEQVSEQKKYYFEDNNFTKNRYNKNSMDISKTNRTRNNNSTKDANNRSRNVNNSTKNVNNRSKNVNNRSRNVNNSSRNVNSKSSNNNLAKNISRTKSNNLKSDKKMNNVNEQRINGRNLKDSKIDTSNKNYVNAINQNSKTSLKVPKKVKHYDSIKRQLQNFSNDGFVPSKNVNIEDESFLLLPAVSSRQKSQVVMKEKIHPKDFSLDLQSNNIRKVNQYTSYYGDHHGPGRGFGNHDINNMMNFGESSRVDRAMFNVKLEGNINERRDILFKNYQDPQHLILPFPRGGEITRKTHNKTDFKKPTEEEIREFSFKY